MKSVSNGIGLVALLTAGVCTSVHADPSNTKDIVAVGPVEIVEASGITVLGREYRIQDTSGLVAGDRVAVHGALQPDGSASNAWAESLGTYAAGSDPVFETGIVTKVDADSGQLSIGGSDVDYTQTLAVSGATIPTVGQLVSVEGIQPTAGGVILGSTTNAGITGMNVALAGAAAGASGGRSAGIIGSGGPTSGIIGSGGPTSGIIGSGGPTSGIIGSGGPTSGIIGSGGPTSGIIGSGGPTG